MNPAALWHGTGNTQNEPASSTVFGGPLPAVASVEAPPRQPSPALQQFGIDDARKATKVGEEETSLTRLFPFDDQEMRQIFGCKQQHFKMIGTELDTKTNEETGDLEPKGSLSFHNFYGNSIWIMASNYRDPELVAPSETDPGKASFYMNDIIKMQAEACGKTSGPAHLVRKTMASEDAKDFFEEHTFQHMDMMSGDQFDQFMNATANGKSSSRILKDFGLKAESARVLIYKEAVDDDFSEYEDDDFGGENSERSPSLEGGELEYGVVLKTAALTQSGG